MSRNDAQGLAGIALLGLLAFQMATRTQTGGGPPLATSGAEREQYNAGILGYAALLRALEQHDGEHAAAAPTGRASRRAANAQGK